VQVYHPAVLELFSSLDRDITLAFLRDYPTPAHAGRVGPARMAAFCARHGYSGRTRPAARRAATDEDTIDLIRRLAVHYPDAQIAGILNRQHRRTAKGLSYTPARVQTLRFRNDIPGRRPSRAP
jgi:hypothetical protein